MANRDKENDNLTGSSGGRGSDSGSQRPSSPDRNQSDFDKGVSRDRDRGGMTGSPGSTDQGDSSKSGSSKSGSGSNRDSGSSHDSGYGSNR